MQGEHRRMVQLLGDAEDEAEASRSQVSELKRALEVGGRPQGAVLDEQAGL